MRWRATRWLATAVVLLGLSCGRFGYDDFASAGDAGPLPATCNDGERNGDESDLDCGGSCERCAVGAACGLPADCSSSVCDANTCLAPTCSDGVLNGGEVAIDSGDVCPCEGNRALGFCWSLGAEGEDCFATCDGDPISEGTIDFVGSGGTQQNCVDVLEQAFDLTDPTAFAPNGEAMGCYFEVGDQPKWDNVVPTTLTALRPLSRRLCSCRQ